MKALKCNGRALMGLAPSSGAREARRRLFSLLGGRPRGSHALRTRDIAGERAAAYMAQPRALPGNFLGKAPVVSAHAPREARCVLGVATQSRSDCQQKAYQF